MDANKTKVSSVMSRDVVTVEAGDSLAKLMDAMLSRNVSHVPVIDERRALVGIVSKTDLVSDRAMRGDTAEQAEPVKTMRRGVRYTLGAGFHLEVAPEVTVADVMTSQVISIADTASLSQAAALMASHRVHGLPVISKARGLVGFISTADVTQWVARS